MGTGRRPTGQDEAGGGRVSARFFTGEQHTIPLCLMMAGPKSEKKRDQKERRCGISGLLCLSRKPQCVQCESRRRLCGGQLVRCVVVVWSGFWAANAGCVGWHIDAWEEEGLMLRLDVDLGDGEKAPSSKPRSGARGGCRGPSVETPDPVTDLRSALT